MEPALSWSSRDRRSVLVHVSPLQYQHRGQAHHAQGIPCRVPPRRIAVARRCEAALSQIVEDREVCRHLWLKRATIEEGVRED